MVTRDIQFCYLAMLFTVAKEDGKITLFEEQYIDRFTKKFNLSESEKDKIKSSPAKYLNNLPDSYADRLNFFYNLLFIMGVDNEITEGEIEMCKKIGFKLCFNPMLMDDLIKIMVKNIGKNVPVDEVINSVIKYQN